MALDEQVVEYLGVDYHEEEQRNTLTFTAFLKLPYTALECILSTLLKLKASNCSIYLNGEDT